MQNCYSVKTQKELFGVIHDNALNIVRDGKPLSKDRTASIFNLKNGNIIIVSDIIFPNCKGLLIDNIDCLDTLLSEGNLPLENPEKDLFEYDQDNLINISTNIEYFKNHLNSVTGLNYSNIDRENFENYYNSILRIYNSDKYNPKDALALLVIAGEIVRKERKGRWMLVKHSSDYNPFYEPVILLEDDNFIELSFYVLNRLSNGLLYDEMYLKNLLNAMPTSKIKYPFDKKDYIIFNR